MHVLLDSLTHSPTLSLTPGHTYTLSHIRTHTITFTTISLTLAVAHPHPRGTPQANAEAEAAAKAEAAAAAEQRRQLKAERAAEAAKAKERMFGEVNHMKRREKSLHHRKQAAVFAQTLAQQTHLGAPGADVKAMRPLVTRRSKRSVTDGAAATAGGGPAKGLGAELDSLPVPASGGGGLKVVPSAAPSKKKSVRKSIRNMFQSKRGKRPGRGASKNTVSRCATTVLNRGTQ